MRGFLRLVLNNEEAGEYNVTLRNDELVGLLTVSPTTVGVGGVRVDNANVENETIARANCNQYDGQEVYGPFQHSSRRLLITVQGTGTHASVYVWKDTEGRRWNF